MARYTQQQIDAATVVQCVAIKVNNVYEQHAIAVKFADGSVCSWREVLTEAANLATIKAAINTHCGDEPNLPALPTTASVVNGSVQGQTVGSL